MEDNQLLERGSWTLDTSYHLVFPRELHEKSIEWKKRGEIVVTLNGSFDLMHAGHLHIIYEAKKQGSLLLVALNSDESIRSYKGPDRPVITLRHRIEMMAAIRWVDFVTWFDETDPCQFLEKVSPDVHVNGSEYGENCIEAEVVRKGGGRLHLVQRIPLLASSHVIAKIRSLPEKS